MKNLIITSLLVILMALLSSEAKAQTNEPIKLLSTEQPSEFVITPCGPIQDGATIVAIIITLCGLVGLGSCALRAGCRAVTNIQHKMDDASNRLGGVMCSPLLFAGLTTNDATPYHPLVFQYNPAGLDSPYSWLTIANVSTYIYTNDDGSWMVCGWCWDASYNLWTYEETAVDPVTKLAYLTFTGFSNRIPFPMLAEPQETNIIESQIQQTPIRFYRVTTR